MDALAGRPPRRRSRRIRLAILISLLIHVAIGLLLLVTIRREGTPELLPPPSPVTMVFESGRKTGPTLPNPGAADHPIHSADAGSATGGDCPAPDAANAAGGRTAPALALAAGAPVGRASDAITPDAITPRHHRRRCHHRPCPRLRFRHRRRKCHRPKSPHRRHPAAEQAPIPPPPPPVAKPSPAPKPPRVRPPPKQPTPPKPSDFPAPMNFSFGQAEPRVAIARPAAVRAAYPRHDRHVAGAGIEGHGRPHPILGSMTRMRQAPTGATH